MAIIRKSYSGAAVSTTLTSGISSSATSIPVAATTGFPNTAVGPFVVVIERGTVNEEKVLVSSFTSNSLTVQARGYDGTTAVAHNNGVSLVCSNDAISMQEAHDAAALVGTVAPTSSAVGDAAAAGTSLVVAAADHRHGREAFFSSVPPAAAVAGSAGTSLNVAHGDHVHPFTDTGWTTITSFLNSYSATDPINYPVRWRILNNVVWVQGAVSPPDHWYNMPAFQLPAACYPALNVIATAAGVPVVVPNAGGVRVDTSGNVSPYGAVAGPCYMGFSYPLG